MDPYCVVFKVHEAFERMLGTFIVGEWAVPTRLKPVVPVKVALQRMFAAEDVLSLELRQRSIADANLVRDPDLPVIVDRFSRQKRCVTDIKTREADSHPGSAVVHLTAKLADMKKIAETNPGHRFEETQIRRKLAVTPGIIATSLPYNHSRASVKVIL